MIFEVPTRQFDFKHVYSVANEILATSRTIVDFPFKVSDFLREQSDIKLCSYKKARVKYGISIPMFGSESAVIMEYQGAYIIFYNQDEQDYRVRFSIMHEFAHYILHHDMNLATDNPLYGIQEIEANCFAAQILMPEQILRECQLYRHKKPTTDFIMRAFEVSEEAAKKRMGTLARTHVEWRSREESAYDDILLTKFSKKIDSIAPPVHNRYEFEDEYDRQRERDSWTMSGWG